MAVDYLTKLDTEHFSDVELAAKEVATQVEHLQSRLSAVKAKVDTAWVGNGRQEFNNLYKVVGYQLKDISKEFWTIYDTLVDAEGVYLEADQELATEIASDEQDRIASHSSGKAGGFSGNGGGVR